MSLKSSKSLKRFLAGAAASVGLLSAIQPVQAAFHLWQIREIYTNASGSVQYVELFTTFNSQNLVAGHTITSNGKTFTFPANGPTPTNSRTYLLASPGFATIPGAVTPNYTLPAYFLNTVSGTVNFTGVDRVDYSSIPTDGLMSRTFTVAATTTPPDTSSITANSPTNHGLQTGSLALRPGDVNVSGSVTALDIDLLFDEVQAGTNRPLFEQTGDGLVNGADVTRLVQTILGTAFGDADLNKQVSIGDLTILAEHFGGTGGWADGDFNGDGSIGIGDLTLLAENFGFSAGGPAALTAVPLPGACWAGLALLGLAGASRRRR